MTLSGIICPLLTPFENDGRIARDLWVAHAKSVLDQGAHYLSPFGTTGEALSMTIAERVEAVDWLLAAGIPAARLMPGTGMCALGDTTVLTAHAVQSGCAAAMVLPSFFYGNTGAAGQARYFSDLIEAVGDDRLRMILYHIPQNSGVPVPPSLVAVLAGRFPDTVVAYKDSAGQWDNTAAVIAAAPSVAVFPGSEMFLTQGLAAGGAGCISATVNINAGGIRAVYDGLRAGRDMAAEDAEMKRIRLATQQAGLIGGMKALMAVRSGDRRWLNLRAPHLDAEWAAGAALAAVV
jgi:4-hydroxy-tetrahydrodipicolinate synthase